MKRPIHIGCCGWSTMDKKSFADLLPDPTASALQFYAHLFDSVEVNSTFYRLPKTSTAERWRQESTRSRVDFHFTVKAYREITHSDRFGTASRAILDGVKEVSSALSAGIILFQSPPSFGPTPGNINRMRTFFTAVERDSFTFVWEPRGMWVQERKLVSEVCGELSLVHCVDPFRSEPMAFGKTDIAYFRLHGLGSRSMYEYEFPGKELESLQTMIRKLPANVREVYVFFNNVMCYQNALDFSKMMNGNT